MRWLESLAAEATSLDAYLRAIARYPELTSTEERHLAERVQQRDEQALARLAGSQLGLVLRYAETYRQLGVRLADLVHDGNLALVDAARRFDPDRHGRFAVYALWWVRQGIFYRLSQAVPGAGVYDGDARAALVAAALGAIVEHACTPPHGEDTARRGPDEPWRITPEVERFEDEELDLDDISTLLVEESEEAVRQALASNLGVSLLELEPKERRALELRLGLRDGEPRSVQQTGAHLRLSPARVERLSARAVQKLRRHHSVRSSLN